MSNGIIITLLLWNREEFVYHMTPLGRESKQRLILDLLLEEHSCPKEKLNSLLASRTLSQLRNSSGTTGQIEDADDIRS